MFSSILSCTPNLVTMENQMVVDVSES